MKKRLLFAMILGLAFTQSAYAKMQCSYDPDIDLTQERCDSIVDVPESAPSRPLTVQRDNTSSDDSCPLAMAYSGHSGKPGSTDDVDSSGGGRNSAGVAGF